MSKPEQIKLLKTRQADLLDMIALALPYVECALDDDAYSVDGKQRITRLAGRMKKAVEAAPSN